MKKIVLLGGGHAHLLTLTRLSRLQELGCRVSVVQPSPYHYYSGMGPGLLSGMYAPEDIRFATQRIVQEQGGEFIQDQATGIDAPARTVRLQSGRELAYDILSCNVGSFVPSGIVRPEARDVFAVKPIESLLRAGERVQELLGQGRTSFAVLGGGPAALEIAANLRRLISSRTKSGARVLIFAGARFFSRYPEKLRQIAGKAMRRLEIEIVAGSYVQEVDTNYVRLENKEVFQPDIILLAVGVRPSSIFQASALPTGPDQGLLVNKYLQSVKHPEIFGGGDCIHFQPGALDKAGVHAVRQNPVLLHNLRAMLGNSELQSFRPRHRYMLIFNTGDGRGILVRGKLVLSGRWAFKLKDHIDRGFIRRFQTPK